MNIPVMVTVQEKGISIFNTTDLRSFNYLMQLNPNQDLYVGYKWSLPIEDLDANRLVEIIEIQATNLTQHTPSGHKDLAGKDFPYALRLIIHVKPVEV